MLDTYGYIVLLARRRPGSNPAVESGIASAQAAAATTSGWYDFEEVDTLIPMEVSNHVAPEFARAKMQLNIGVTRQDVWHWKDDFSHEDRIMICSDHVEVADQDILFEGFVGDVDWSFDRNESLTATAVSLAARLALDADRIVYGRKMLDSNDVVRGYGNLPCHFNAGGRPNMHPTIQKDLGAAIPESSTSGWHGCYGVRVFTYDNDPDAAWWTPVDIFNYLQWRYNFDQDWLSNALFSGDDYNYSANRPIEVAVEGLNLWQALAAVGEQAGWDISEQTTNDGEGNPAHSISILRRHEGPVRVVTHQPVNADGTFANLDIDQTDLFSASIAETTVSSVARPYVLGGAALYEITVELGKAWNSTTLALPTGELADPNASVKSQPNYYGRYCVGGGDFCTYADAGRLWDANTDGKYSASPYSLTVADVAALVGYDAGRWPAMPFKPAPCLTALGSLTNGASRQTYVEVSFDAGTTWQPLTGCSVLPDRLAIRITQANLAQIKVISASSGANKYQDNLFYRLANDAANVKVRLTCTIVSPLRIYHCPARRTTAGTIFGQGRLFDRGQAGQVRSVSASSRFYGLGLPADEVTFDAADLTIKSIAQQIQDAAEDRFIEASLPVEWVDPPVRVGDVIERINGINYDLKVNCGPRKVSPRVIGYTHLLTPESYSTQIVLDTDRKAGMY